ncbi:MAG: WecB/TagA/CpsF family glycosyltransferase [Candidatus Aminicenantes bacterium]|nr:WecB/TagA/CpsF family glycosyltransferase [Candidatus Aminicenantes bacterium]
MAIVAGDRNAGRGTCPPAIDVLGLKVQAHTPEDLNESIGRIICGGGHDIIPNVNVHFANLAWRRPWLRDLFNSASVNFCDGAGIQLAARILGGRIGERITYGDWFGSLAAFCKRERFRLFLMGGQPGVAVLAARQLKDRFPGLIIAGTQHGFFDRDAESMENAAVIVAINRSRPDILLVALGMPLQEEWLARNWERIDARVALTGGAILDYLSGRMKRPPAWMCRCGWEWLGRLLIEPRRLWKRYLIGNPLFLARVLRQRLGRPFPGSAS